MMNALNLEISEIPRHLNSQATGAYLHQFRFKEKVGLDKLVRVLGKTWTLF